MFPALIGTGAGLAIGGTTAYAAIAPGSQFFGRTFCRGNGERQVALTYDDGPNDRETLRLLDVLEGHSARATFFLIGQFVKARPAIVREILARGHALGNHTWSHPNLFWSTPRRVRRELADCQKAIEDATGEMPLLFRPPYGSRRPDVLSVARELDLTPVMWSATCFDWRANEAASVFRWASRDIERPGFGSVVLLHDGDHRRMGADRSPTVEATEQLLKNYRPRKYEFVTIPEMMQTAKP